jgi:hypothetical protein
LTTDEDMTNRVVATLTSREAEQMARDVLAAVAR